MSEQSALKTILNALTSKRSALADYVKAEEEKIAGLEIAYEALTGEKPPTSEHTHASKRQPSVRKGGRRGMRIDRKGAEKTYAFLKERGEKPTTPAMVARKFNITPEAASQRLLNLHKTGTIARVDTGRYVDAAIIAAANSNSGSSARKTEMEIA